MANRLSFLRSDAADDEPKAATWAKLSAREASNETGTQETSLQPEALKPGTPEPDADEKAAEKLLEKFTVPSKLKRRRKPQYLRRVLLALGPLVVIAGGLYAYMAGGRYVSTDDAYVHAGKLTIATDVSGIVANIAVRESQKVEKGQVLFSLDQEPFRIALAGAEANLGTVRNQLATLAATYRQKQAQIAQARTDVAFYETGFQRQQDLLKRGVAAQ